MAPFPRSILAALSVLAMTAAACASDRAIIVLDGSGSMWGHVDGRPKLEIARDTLRRVLSSVPADLELGFMAYGHREKGSCEDIELIVPPAANSAGAIAAAASGMRFLGATPLTDAVRQAAEALGQGDGKATVVLVTDGVETCEADPCAVATELERSGIDFTAHVVGFGLSAEEGREVACLAENTGGRYIQASDEAGLEAALVAAVTPEPEPEPAPEPAPTSSPDPDPAPAQESASEQPLASEAAPPSEPGPAPAPEPRPAPASSPEPSPAPETAPDGEASPDAASSPKQPPEPEAAPAPAAAPEPAPGLSSLPESAPAPSQVPEAAPDGESPPDAASSPEQPPGPEAAPASEPAPAPAPSTTPEPSSSAPGGEPVPTQTPAPATPESVRPAYNFTPSLLLAEGSSPLPDSGQSWRIHEANPDGSRGDYVTTGYGRYRGSLPAGDYLVTATLGEASAEQKVTVSETSVAAPDFVLDAGRLIIHPRMNEDAAVFAEAKVVLNIPGQGDASYYGDVEAVVPAGTLNVTVSIGSGEAAETVEVGAGDTVERDVVVGVGHVVINAVYTPDGDRVDSPGVAFDVLKAARKADDSRQHVASSYGPDSGFHLPTGDYVVIARMEEAAVEQPFNIRVGENKELAVALDAGVLVVSAPGFSEIALFSARKDVYGNRKGFGIAYSDHHRVTLPAGDYVVAAKRAGTGAVREVDVTVRAGTRLEVTVE